MRAIVLTLLTLTALVICFGVIIGAGMMRLSSGDAFASAPGSSTTTTPPTTEPADEPTELRLVADTQPTTEPAAPPIDDGSIMLAASEALLVGPHIVLMDSHSKELRRGEWLKPGRVNARQPEVKNPAAAPDKTPSRRSTAPFISRMLDSPDVAEWRVTAPRRPLHGVADLRGRGQAGAAERGRGPQT